MGTFGCYSAVSLHHLQHVQFVALLFLGLMATSIMANLPVFHGFHPKLLAANPLGFKAATGVDANNDGVDDGLDRNLNGVVEIPGADFPAVPVPALALGGFPFFGLPAVLPVHH